MDRGFSLRAVCNYQETIALEAKSLHNFADIEPDSV